MSTPQCRSCEKPLRKTFVDLGLSPLANSFIKEEHSNSAEIFYPLHARVCESCFLVQLEVFEKAENIFSDYLYFSSFSSSWLDHAKKYSDQMMKRFNLKPQSRIVEVASNDGYLLQFFKEKGMNVLGIEPAANVAEVAKKKGVHTLVEFFGKKCASGILKRGELGADLMAANNVLAHVPDLNDFISGFKVLLAKSGVATFEFPHLLNLVQKNQFDTIYHEHFSYLSLLAVSTAFARHDLEVFDVEELSTHGGSLRIFVQHTAGPHAMTENLKQMQAKEHEAGMHQMAFYEQFENKVHAVKNNLLRFLVEQKQKGKNIVGYGAAAKGNTLLNYCGIRADFLDYTADRNSHKQGTYLPGTRIPVCSPEKIFETKPDFVFILPWNLREEISQELNEIRSWGGRFVTAIPDMQVF